MMIAVFQQSPNRNDFSDQTLSLSFSGSLGGDLLDFNEVSVARTLIAHAGGMGFRRTTSTNDDGAAPVRRPGAVIVTHDGLGLAVAESDLVDRHCGTSPKVAARLLIRYVLLDLRETFLCFFDQLFND
jgi:hypothetical protein